MKNLISALIAGFTTMVKRPAVFLPAVILSIINGVLLFLSYDILFEFLFDVIFLERFSEVSVIELPFIVISNYPWHLLVILLLAVVSLALQMWVLVAVSKFLSSKASKIFEAIGYANGKILDVFGLAIILFIIGFIYLVILFGVLWVLLFSAELGWLLLIVLGLAGIYLFVKLFFAAIIMGIENLNVKKSLAHAWDFSRKRFWGVLVFSFLVSLIAALIEGFGSTAASGITDDLFGILAGVIIMIFSSAYFSAASAKYYLNAMRR